MVLLPYWISLYHNPIKQMPIPHTSRTNYLESIEWGLNYFIIPWGAMMLALPFIFFQGFREKRFVPLFLGFWLTLIFGLGGTTPLPKILLGRAFEIVTFERFTFWATLIALPFIGLLAMITGRTLPDDIAPIARRVVEQGQNILGLKLSEQRNQEPCPAYDYQTPAPSGPAAANPSKL